jgi:hypothetical protein
MDLQQRREAHVASLSTLADRFCFYNRTDTLSTACQHGSQPELDSHQSAPGFGRHRRDASLPGSSPSEALASRSSAGGTEWGAGAAVAKIEKLNKQLHAVRQLALREQSRAEAAEVWSCAIHKHARMCYLIKHVSKAHRTIQGKDYRAKPTTHVPLRNATSAKRQTAQATTQTLNCQIADPPN